MIDALDRRATASDSHNTTEAVYACAREGMEGRLRGEGEASRVDWEYELTIPELELGCVTALIGWYQPRPSEVARLCSWSRWIVATLLGKGLAPAVDGEQEGVSPQQLRGERMLCMVLVLAARTAEATGHDPLASHALLSLSEESLLPAARSIEAPSQKSDGAALHLPAAGWHSTSSQENEMQTTETPMATLAGAAAVQGQERQLRLVQLLDGLLRAQLEPSTKRAFGNRIAALCLELAQTNVTSLHVSEWPKEEDPEQWRRHVWKLFLSLLHSIGRLKTSSAPIPPLGLPTLSWCLVQLNQPHVDNAQPCLALELLTLYAEQAPASSVAHESAEQFRSLSSFVSTHAKQLHELVPEDTFCRIAVLWLRMAPGQGTPARLLQSTAERSISRALLLLSPAPLLSCLSLDCLAWLLSCGSADLREDRDGSHLASMGGYVVEEREAMHPSTSEAALVAELLLDLALSTHGPCTEPFVVDSREAAAAAAVDLREPKHLLIRACLLAAKATAATCRGLIGAQLHVTHSRQGGLQALLKLILDCLEFEENDGEKSVCRDPPSIGGASAFAKWCVSRELPSTLSKFCLLPVSALEPGVLGLVLRIICALAPSAAASGLETSGVALSRLNHMFSLAIRQIQTLQCGVSLSAAESASWWRLQVEVWNALNVTFALATAKAQDALERTAATDVVLSNAQLLHHALEALDPKNWALQHAVMDTVIEPVGDTGGDRLALGAEHFNEEKMSCHTGALVFLLQLVLAHVATKNDSGTDAVIGSAHAVIGSALTPTVLVRTIRFAGGGARQAPLRTGVLLRLLAWKLGHSPLCAADLPPSSAQMWLSEMVSAEFLSLLLNASMHSREEAVQAGLASCALSLKRVAVARRKPGGGAGGVEPVLPRWSQAGFFESGASIEHVSLEQLASHPWNLFAFEQMVQEGALGLADSHVESSDFKGLNASLCLYWAILIEQRPLWTHSLMVDKPRLVGMLLTLLAQSCPFTECHKKLAKALEALGPCAKLHWNDKDRAELRGRLCELERNGQRHWSRDDQLDPTQIGECLVISREHGVLIPRAQ